MSGPVNVRVSPGSANQRNKLPVDSVRVRVSAGIAAGLPVPAPVTSVAGRTGAVVLTVSDVAGAQPETTVTVGSLIAAAADKATPVDADILALSDSAAAGILKRFSWTNLKAALNGIFARLPGIAGGQTLIGGTQAADALTLQGTSASGTASAAKALRVLSGDAGAVEAVTVLNNGNVGIGNTSPGQALNVGTALNVLADGRLSIGAATPGQVTTPATVVKGLTNIELALTDDNAARRSACASYFSLNPTANVTQLRYSNYNWMETKTGATVSYSNLRGLQNWINHTGLGAVTAGFASLSSMDIAGSGSGGTLVGNAGQVRLTSTATNATATTAYGFVGTVINQAPGAVITTAVAVLAEIDCANATATITNAVGVGIDYPGSWQWDVTGTITNCYALYIGSRSNAGTNKWAIYSLSGARSYLAGSLAIGLDAASAKLHAVATTEQLRLGYDAANYASFTVNASGQLKIDAALTIRPPASITPVVNGDLAFELTSNTTLTIKAKGSDGVVRSAAITLS